MKQIVALLFLLFVTISIAQPGESLGPLKYNTELLKNNVGQTKKLGNATFDSTFYYLSDTISLPFFDDFTTNLSQTYDSDYTDPNVSDTLFYALLDSATLNPLVDTSRFMFNPTFTFIVDTSGVNDTTYENPKMSIKICFLNQYPLQIIDTVVYPRYNIYDTLNFPSSPDTTWIIADIEQDSARLFFVQLNATGYLWIDNNAYHNYRFPVDPWSQGVRTLDGVDENGMPYNLGNLSAYGIGDYLTSKPIDLSANNVADSIMLSFLYQPKGLGNTPDAEDSLFVEFFQPDSSEWFRVWVTPGGFDTTGFLEGRIMIQTPSFIKKGFQFRFGSYASLSGNLDHWHLDYVRLRVNGNFDTLYNDIAIVYPNFTIIDTYTSTPWEHYKNYATPNDLMLDTVKMLVRNNNTVPAIQPDTVGYISVDYQGANQWQRYQGSIGTGNWEVGNKEYDILVKPFYTIDQNLHDTTVTLDCEIMLTGTATDNAYEINDTTRIQVEFENYYAYDDGTAEAAYGPTGSLAALAYQFNPLEPDSLLGVYIGFVPSVTDVSIYEFVLTVWDDNGGQPGNVIYEDDAFDPRYPEYPWEHNGFRYYALQDSMKLYVDGTFYVGWKQYDSQRLNIGMDLNRDNSDRIFYSINNQNSWNNTVFPGSLLMRPVFDTDMNYILGYPEKTIERNIAHQFTVYPNPTSGILNIAGEINEISNVVLYDMAGNLVQSYGQSYAIDVTFLNSGIYLMRIVDKNGIHYNHKIIKN
ncbi:MAG: T9SS type A sorting domain-containing protein [Crocinitomicaceae bacterium]|nr:T9SS type A sorting domain-containing protein [Crocinitomicaceae bacterium]